LQVFGSANSHVFLKSPAGRTITWHELAPGDSAQLKRDVPGTIAVRLEEPMLLR